MDHIIVRAAIDRHEWDAPHVRADAASFTAEVSEEFERAPLTFVLLTTADVLAVRCASRGVKLAMEWALEAASREGERRPADGACHAERVHYSLSADDSDGDLPSSTMSDTPQERKAELEALGYPFSFN